MAYLGRSWRRVMAVGCTHGDLVHPDAQAQVLAFKELYQPEVRFELGDLIDMAAFRTGAGGTRDESHSTRDDRRAALEWLDKYEPNRVTWGNHDWRLYEMLDHPRAIVRDLAGEIWDELSRKVESLGAWTADYDIEDNWIYEAGVAWGHGFMYNINAVRDHAETLGCPVVMAHLHTPQQVPGRTIKNSMSFCVGALADDRKLRYGRRRRQSLAHGHGIVFGEICDDAAQLWLAHAPNGGELVFPPGVV